MEFRFVKVTSFYKNFLHEYYKSNPGIVTQSYEEQYQHLMDQGYGYANYFPLYLQQKFSISGTEIVHNAKPLQDAWAQAKGLDLRGNQLLLEQLKTYRPEILFIQDSINFSEAFIKKIREEVKSVRLLIGHCCAPYTSSNIKAFSHYDLMLACSERFLEDFRNMNIRSYRFPHAIESSLIRKIEEHPKPLNEIVFIGSLLYRSGFHKERISYIEEILRNNLPLQIIGQLESDPFYTLKMKQAAYLAVRLLSALKLKSIYKNSSIHKIEQLNEMPRKSRYKSSIRKNIKDCPPFGLEMLKTIAGYSIGFNLHGEVAGDYAANVRMFEVSGAGALLVTDHKKNIESLFEPEKEILTYKSKEECIEKLQWAIDHPIEAGLIARAGQKRTLRDHSVEKRAELLYEIIQKEL